MGVVLYGGEMHKAKRGSPHFLLTCGGAALIAIVGTVLGVAILYSVEYGGANVLLQRFAFALTIGLVYAIVLGFIGAFIFLLVGLGLARAIGASVQGYTLWGALAGLAHEIVGHAYYALWTNLPNEVSSRMVHLNYGIVFLGGFLMNGLDQDFDTRFLFLIVPIAGGIAGLFAGWRMAKESKVEDFAKF